MYKTYIYILLIYYIYKFISRVKYTHNAFKIRHKCLISDYVVKIKKLLNYVDFF